MGESSKKWRGYSRLNSSGMDMVVMRGSDVVDDDGGVVNGCNS